MILKIRDEYGERRGTLEISDLGEVSFDENFNKDTETFIRNSIQTGISLRGEKFNADENEFILQEKIITQKDEFFDLALRDFLTRAGYMVDEHDAEIDKKILEIVYLLPEGNEQREAVVKKLPELTRLDKTYLLRELTAE